MHVASARPARPTYLDHVSKNREKERDGWIEVEWKGIKINSKRPLAYTYKKFQCHNIALSSIMPMVVMFSFQTAVVLSLYS